MKMLKLHYNGRLFLLDSFAVMVVEPMPEAEDVRMPAARSRISLRGPARKSPCS